MNSVALTFAFFKYETTNVIFFNEIINDKRSISIEIPITIILKLIVDHIDACFKVVLISPTFKVLFMDINFKTSLNDINLDQEDIFLDLAIAHTQLK